MPYTRLRRERQRRGWSQVRLARTLRVDNSTVSYWESGYCLPRRRTADDLETIFGLPADELLAPDDDADTSP